MNIHEIHEMAESYPTLMDLSNEIFLIRLLKTLSSTEIEKHAALFESILLKIQESHNYGNIFEVNSDNESIFRDFLNWVRSIENELQLDFSGLTDGLELTAADIKQAMQKKT